MLQHSSSRVVVTGCGLLAAWPASVNSGVAALLAAPAPRCWLQAVRSAGTSAAPDKPPPGSSSSSGASPPEEGGSSTPGDQQQPQQEPQQERVNMQHEAQEVSKAFLTKSLSMDELWFSAVGGKLKMWSARAHPELQGKEQEVLDRVQAEYLDTLARSATGRLLTNRSRNQLKQACLAASTYKVLVDTVPSDAQGVEQHIADCMGGLYAPFLLGGLRFSSFVRRVLLRQSSVSQAVDTLHTLARDMEGACHCSVQPLACASESDADDAQEGAAQQHQQPAGATAASGSEAGGTQQPPEQQQQWEQQEEAEAKAAAAAALEHHTQHEWQDGAALTVDSCMFADVLKAEGVPQLLRYFCCQHNMSWLQVYAKHGVAPALEACIGKGDACCRITVTPTAAAS